MLNKKMGKVINDGRMPKFPFLYQNVKMEQLLNMEENFKLKVKKL